jgi:hypothetical protein
MRTFPWNGKWLALLVGAVILGAGLGKYPSIDFILVVVGIILLFIGYKIPIND